MFDLPDHEPQAKDDAEAGEEGGQDQRCHSACLSDGFFQAKKNLPVRRHSDLAALRLPMTF
jgi:hypothetical protein